MTEAAQPSSLTRRTKLLWNSAALLAAALNMRRLSLDLLQLCSVKTQISETGLDAELLEGLLLITSVMMRNHGNREVVHLLELLAELSKAQVMPGIRPQIHELKRRRLGCRAGSLKHLFP